MSATTETKKRSFEATAAKDDHPNEQEVRAMSRSERKRHREKKRRSDVNKGFDELMSLLLEIDPEVRADAEERASKGQCKRTLGSHEDNVLSRVDLIATAVRVLGRIHGENEKHKRIIEDFLKGGNGSAAFENEFFSRSGIGGQGVDSHGHGHGSGASWADRQSFLSGLGGSPQAAWEAAQLRAAQASRYPSLSHHLGGYPPADLLALRGGIQSSAADSAFLSQLGNNSAMQRSIIQNLLQQGPAPNNRAMTETLYSALEGTNPSFRGGKSTEEPEEKK